MERVSFQEKEIMDLAAKIMEFLNKEEENIELKIAATSVASNAYEAALNMKNMQACQMAMMNDLFPN